MAKKINIEKTKMRMDKLTEKISKLKTDLETYEAEYTTLSEQLKTAEAIELVELLAEHNMSLDDVKSKLLTETKKES